MFDTGSSETWVISNTCYDRDCQGHKMYVETSTFFDANFGRRLITTFLSGSITSRVGHETIDLGDDVIVPNATLNLVTQMDVPVLKTLGWDGIVGLGFTSIEQAQQGRSSLLDYIKQANILTNLGRRNQFSYTVGTFGGFVSFGGAYSKRINPLEVCLTNKFEKPSNRKSRGFL
eukprot:Gregarina_sp_Poly_1__336@NODE_1080_length_5163_cov_33_713305_g728_i1_p3_GENE_NODE_1080_length_5163_cov_33_713305_g728_i1NODE_1080_length_5163_cov_33_713305_g728_i1_p3_ORF_typecomplete_len174_score14_48Asp/PF00026_23/8e23TAXi_N/PF14543_6/0_51_NODE_1080_length_5163_cov_33_713305_g728_i1304825